MNFIVKEGLFLIKIFLMIALSSYVIGSYFNLRFLVIAAILFFLIAIFSVFFFRNPNRVITAKENEICSPADGTVMEITEEYNDWFKDDVKVIRIFLSVFNVHVQRAPIAGVIENIEYKEGKFLPAMDKRAHLENEQNSIFIDGGNNKKIICTQIAGLIARRIVMWKNEGSEVKQGELYGMIKFGSQVDIYLPKTAQVLVKVKDKVKAGTTIISKF
jgi:phosphatidylserine decarboxylase